MNQLRAYPHPPPHFVFFKARVEPPAGETSAAHQTPDRSCAHSRLTQQDKNKEEEEEEGGRIDLIGSPVPPVMRCRPQRKHKHASRNSVSRLSCASLVVLFAFIHPQCQRHASDHFLPPPALRLPPLPPPPPIHAPQASTPPTPSEINT